jgi:peptide/nickel transport system permease protein
VSVISFSLVHLIPGDPAIFLAGDTASEEQVNLLRAELGLDRPLPMQYLSFLAGILRARLGESLRSGLPIGREILVRFPATLQLTAFSMLLAVFFGLLLGAVAAVRAGKPADHLIMASSLIGISLPGYVLAFLLIYLFAVILHLLPAGGSGSFRHLILPGLSLASRSIAELARLARSSLLDVLGEDYIVAARAKGIAETAVVARHAMKNSLIPIITLIGLQMGSFLAGAVVTETIFAWPGIGRYIILSIQFRDYPAVQASIMFLAFNFVLINLATDLVCARIDPRIRLGRAGKRA